MFVIRAIKKFNILLSSKQKKGLGLLLVLMIVGGLLEMVSVSAIVPFMNDVLNPDLLMEKSYVREICYYLNIKSSTTFLLFSSFVLAIVYILKNIFLTYEYVMQYKFVYENMYAIQTRLHQSFIRQPYEYHLAVDSGKIIRLINTDTQQAFYMLTSVLNLLTESVVASILIVTLFVITPSITISMGIIMVILLVVIGFILKPVLKRTGERTNEASAKMYKWLLQSIQGIKEVIVMRKESFFLNQFGKNDREYVNMTRKFNILNIVPRFMIEGCCMGGIFVIVGVMIYIGENLDKMIPMLTAVAMAALRLLPSVNRISTDIGNISYYEPMLDNVIESISSQEKYNKMLELDEHDPEVSLSPEFDIELNNITYHYPNNDKKILDCANLYIKHGTSVGLIGTSGSGKSTTVDIILGLLKCTDGKVLIDGKDIKRDLGKWRNMVGYIPQTIFMLDDSIKANVAFGIEEKKIDDEAVWRALRDASLECFVKSLPNGIDTQIGERGICISGGQRQRIGIARALYLNPQVLLFDEATSSLDNETEKEIMAAIDNLHGEKTMIIIAHRLTTINGCDEVFRIENGKFIRER